MYLQQALQRHGVRYRLSAANAKLHLCCPYCVERGKQRDTRFRLCIHLRDGWGRCLHCDWKARRATRLVLRQLQINELVEGVEPEEQPIPELVELPEDFHRLTRVRDSLDACAKQYLLKRGITEKQVAENGIGVSYIGRYAYRVVFPNYVGSRLVGIIARDFTSRKRVKYLFNRGSKYLYHFQPEAKICILSEGVFKALRLERVSCYCSAALLGHTLAPEQLKQLQKSQCRRVILYPDPDLAGCKGMIAVAEQLGSEWRGSVRVAWPVARPADEDDWKAMRENLKNTSVYGWALGAKIRLYFPGAA